MQPLQLFMIYDHASQILRRGPRGPGLPPNDPGNLLSTASSLPKEMVLLQKGERLPTSLQETLESW